MSWILLGLLWITLTDAGFIFQKYLCKMKRWHGHQEYLISVAFSLLEQTGNSFIAFST
jgi:hypothetical protein